MEADLEEADFGSIVGLQKLYQLPYQQFQLECLSSNLAMGDSTGLRAYSGVHVAIRSLARYPPLVNNMNVIELGCGVGAFGLLGTRPAEPNLMVFTDGEQRAIEILQKNIDYVKPKTITGVISTQILPWGDISAINGALDKCEACCSTRKFDVVLGCELMYFNTDLDLLVNTVLSLINNTGLFIHAHLFRAPNQENQLIETLASYGWTTLEIPSKVFLTAQELDQHVEWRRVRSLVSGPMDAMGKLAAEYPDWIPFQEEIRYDDSDAEDADAINIFNNIIL